MVEEDFRIQIPIQLYPKPSLTRPWVLFMNPRSQSDDRPQWVDDKRLAWLRFKSPKDVLGKP